ncbi:uncharacterized protein LOC142558137 [Dermacentor variabilis]|uniref:uncharacterized protein LOC142558137 n=1 Tax=Dermacentor variabilis TaxID=34621 RepID=UPI003F5C2089
MEPLSQGASKSPKADKARRSPKAYKSDLGHKGAKKNAKEKGPKPRKSHTTTTEAAETTAGSVRVDQTATVPKPEEEVSLTGPSADPTCQAVPSLTERRIVAFVGPSSGPTSHDLQTEHAAVPLTSSAEKTEGAADHASLPTSPTGAEEHPVDTAPVFHRRRPSSSGKDEPAPASGTLSEKTRALDALLKAKDPIQPGKRWPTRKPSCVPEKAIAISQPTKERFGGLRDFLGFRSSAASPLKGGELPIKSPQDQIYSNAEGFSMCAFSDDDVRNVHSTFRSSGRIPETIKTTNQTPPRCTSRAAKNTIAIAFAVAAISTVALILLAALLAPSHSGGTAPSMLCSTEDCVMHSRLINARINTSVDPCKDFHAFTCSAWPPSKEIFSFASGTTRDAVVAWYKGFENLLEMSSERYLPAKKALAMYQACMQGKPASQYGRAGMEALKKFMRQRRILWPGEPDLNVNPLGVLLDFAFNWQTPFWFQVQVLQGNSGERNALVLRLGNLITFWSNYHQNLVADEVYYNYLINYFEAFADASDRRPTREEVARMESLHSDVLDRFLDLQTRNRKARNLASCISAPNWASW